MNIAEFHCPLLHLLVLLRPQRTISGAPEGSTPNEKLPGEGSLSDLHETKARLSPVWGFTRTLMLGKNVSVGWLKLSQMTLSEVTSINSKFPVSRIDPTLLLSLLVDVMFEDQTVMFCPFSNTRLPSLLIVRTPDWSEIGFSLFATQTTALSSMFPYQIPRYRPVEEPGVKKPSSNVFCGETKGL